MSVSISLLVLRCADLPTSVAFYSALGLQFTEEQHGDGPRHYAHEGTDFVLELYPAKNAQVDATTRLGLRVESLQNAVNQLNKMGIAANTQDSPWGVRAVVRDPDGRAIEISEAKAEEL
jgi:catechol 2,3-dioxygenase-like lactoylglutathione lyase family enzyme